MRYIRLLLLSVFFGLSSIVLCLGDEFDNLPKIYCYAIGVSDNPGSLLNDSKNLAETFGFVVSNTFPHSEVKVFTSPTHRATRDVIDKILGDISELPRYSTVIFYFAGHGVRNPQNRDFEEDLHLLLSGAGMKDYKVRTNSLRFAELVDTLCRKKMITGMVIIDSCYSGQAADRNSITGNLLSAQASKSPRYIYCFATDGNEQAVLGEFTGQFLSIITNSASSGCFKPSQLQDQLKMSLQPDAQGLRTREMLPQPLPDWCLATMGKPSSLLVIIPHTDFKSAPRLYFNGKTSAELPIAGENGALFFLCLVPKSERLELVLKYHATFQTNICTPTNLQSDIVLLEAGTDYFGPATESALLTFATSNIITMSQTVVAEVGIGPQSSDFMRLLADNLAKKGESTYASQFYALSSRKSFDEPISPLLAGLFLDPAKVQKTGAPVVASVNTSATYSINGDPWKALEPGTRVPAGATIWTRGTTNDYVDLHFGGTASDANVVRVFANSKVRVTATDAGGLQPNNEVNFDVINGKIAAAVARFPEGDRLSFKVGNSTLAVSPQSRSLFEIDADQQYLAVASGQLKAVQSKSHKRDNSIYLPAGRGVNIGTLKEKNLDSRKLEHIVGQLQDQQSSKSHGLP